MPKSRDGLGGATVIETSIGATTKPAMFEVPPPGPGLVTVTGTTAGEATSPAESGVVSCVELTKVVALVVPLKLIVEPLIKPVPLTAKVNPATPCVTPGGLKEFTTGTGFPVPDCTTVNTELEVNPETVICPERAAPEFAATE
jgi:hypothetical protein